MQLEIQITNLQSNYEIPPIPTEFLNGRLLIWELRKKERSPGSIWCGTGKTKIGHKLKA